MASLRPVTMKCRFPTSPSPATILPGLNTSATLNSWGLQAQASLRTVFGFEAKQSKQQRTRLREWTQQRERAEREAEDRILEIEEDEWEISRKQKVFAGCFVNAPEPGCVRSEVCMTEVGYGQACVDRALERFDGQFECQVAVVTCCAAGGTTTLALMGRAKLPEGLVVEDKDAETADHTAPKRRTSHEDLEDEGLYLGRERVAEAIDMLPDFDSQRVAVATSVMTDGRYTIFVIAQPAPTSIETEHPDKATAAPASKIKIDFAAEMAALQERVTTAFGKVGGDVGELRRELRALRALHGLSTDDLEDDELELFDSDDEEVDFATESHAAAETPVLPLEPQQSSRKRGRDESEASSDEHAARKCGMDRQVPTPPATSSPEKILKPVTNTMQQNNRRKAADEDAAVARPNKRNHATSTDNDKLPKPRRRYVRKVKTLEKPDGNANARAKRAQRQAGQNAGPKRKADAEANDEDDVEPSTNTARPTRKPTKRTKVTLKSPENIEISDEGESDEAVSAAPATSPARAAKSAARTTTSRKIANRRPTTGGKTVPRGSDVRVRPRQGGKSLPAMMEVYEKVGSVGDHDEDLEGKEREN